MKKTILLLGIIFSIYVLIGYKFSQIDIPSDALRIRILANSNSEYDQTVKNELRENIQSYVYDLLKNTNSISTARGIITSRLDEIKKL